MIYISSLGFFRYKTSMICKCLVYGLLSISTGTCGTELRPFFNFLFTYLFSITFLYYFISFSLYVVFIVFVSIYLNSLMVTLACKGGGLWCLTPLSTIFQSAYAGPILLLEYKTGICKLYT